MSKKATSKIYIMLTLLVLAGFAAYMMRQPSKSIKLLQYSEHPALDRTREGVTDYLEECCSLSVQTDVAQGNPVMAIQIAQKFANQSPRAIIAIGTIAAQSFINNTRTIPVIYSSVTDPLGALLVKDNNRGGTNFAGVSNRIQATKQLETFSKILPNLKDLGVIYNPGESNSTTLIAEVKAAAKDLGLNIKEITATNASEATIAAERLAGKTNAIYITNDNNALSTLPGIIRAANKYNTPVFCSDIDTLELGVLAALGPDQYQLGVQTGKIVESILLKGKKPENLPISYAKSEKLYLNLKAARKLGIDISEDIIKQADFISK